MVEQLSRPLRQWLFEAKLVTPRQLDRCRSQVARLTRDLPAFDSVWLDALVQRGYLTSYQARVLEAGDPAQLCLGPWIIVDQMAAGRKGHVYRVRPAGGGQLHVARVVPRALWLSPSADESLRRLVRELQNRAPPSIISPHTVRAENDRLVLISRFAAGLSGAQMLVRRGRFPDRCVWEAGRQLLQDLAELESVGLFHGGVRASSVRFDHLGNVRLVDFGVAACLQRELTIPSVLDVDECDGVAPERIGTGRPPDARSEMYALGSLLWHLLAGRPPFPGADPLVKLAACQTRDVPDVRQLAPQTAAPLAAGIRAMTARNPADRPESLRAVLERWGGPTAAGRRNLAAFRRMFDSPVAGRPSCVTWAWVGAALMVLLLAASAALFHRGARATLLAWSQGIAARRDASDPQPGVSGPNALPNSAARRAPEEHGAVPSHLLPLPAADALGHVVLQAGRQYRAERLAAVGPLTIRGSAGELPEVVVAGRDWKLSADSIRLENLLVRPLGPPAEPGPARPMLVIRAQNLEIDHCVFTTRVQDQAVVTASSHFGNDRVLLGWTAARLQAADRPRCQIRNACLLGGGMALAAPAALASIEFTNCLWLGMGPLVGVASPGTGNAERRIRCRHTTCRTTGPLFLWGPPGPESAAGRWTIDARDCVFELVEEEPALIELTCEPGGDAWWNGRLRITGQGSLVSQLAAAARRREPVDPHAPESRALDETELAIEGLVETRLEFAGPPSAVPQDSVLKAFALPRRTSRPPGIDAVELPQNRTAETTLPGR